MTHYEMLKTYRFSLINNSYYIYTQDKVCIYTHTHTHTRENTGIRIARIYTRTQLYVQLIKFSRYLRRVLYKSRFALPSVWPNREHKGREYVTEKYSIYGSNM